jgi:maleylacetoacetate isomerase
MKLYNYWRSSSSWRVRIALALKGVAYEYIPVNLRAGEQHQDGYVALNPTHTVPLLEVEEGGQAHRIHQSMAIIEYLEERYPKPALLPGTALERAFVRELAELVNSGIQPYQNLSVLQKVKKELNADELAWARGWISQGLKALEARVASRGKRFCAADTPTLADVFLIPQLYGARRYNVDLAPFPALLRAEAACEALPAFQRAHADRQPDAVPDTK